MTIPDFEVIRGRIYTLRIRQGELRFERVDAVKDMAEQYKSDTGVLVHVLDNDGITEVLVSDATYNRGNTYRSVFKSQRRMEIGLNLYEEFLVTIDLGLIAVNLRLLHKVS